MVIDFIDDILNGKKLHGRNKPSWLDKNNNLIPAATSYQTANIWHYHAGPHNKNLSPQTTNVRNPNFGHQTSSSIIHYTWRKSDLDEVVILGFSPDHNCFPLPGDKKNPLRARINNLRRYPDDKLADPFSGDDD